MRPAGFLTVLLALLVAGDLALVGYNRVALTQTRARQGVLDIAVAALGATDLCLATEARYTRHPAVSDRLVAFMDHPGAIEHFPSGSFFTPPDRRAW